MICGAFSIKRWVWKGTVYVYVLYFYGTDQSLLRVHQYHWKPKNPHSPPNCLSWLLSVEEQHYPPPFDPALAFLLHSGGGEREK